MSRGNGTRTHHLRVMNPASCQLLYPAIVSYKVMVGFEPTIAVLQTADLTTCPHDHDNRSRKDRTLNFWFWRPMFYQLNYTPKTTTSAGLEPAHHSQMDSSD